MDYNSTIKKIIGILDSNKDNGNLNSSESDNNNYYNHNYNHNHNHNFNSKYKTIEASDNSNSKYNLLKYTTTTTNNNNFNNDNNSIDNLLVLFTESEYSYSDLNNDNDSNKKEENYDSDENLFLISNKQEILDYQKFYFKILNIFNELYDFTKFTSILNTSINLNPNKTNFYFFNRINLVKFHIHFLILKPLDNLHLGNYGNQTNLNTYDNNNSNSSRYNNLINQHSEEIKLLLKAKFYKEAVYIADKVLRIFKITTSNHNSNNNPSPNNNNRILLDSGLQNIYLNKSFCLMKLAEINSNSNSTNTSNDYLIENINTITEYITTYNNTTKDEKYIKNMFRLIISLDKLNNLEQALYTCKVVLKECKEYLSKDDQTKRLIEEKALQIESKIQKVYHEKEINELKVRKKMLLNNMLSSKV